MGDVQLNTHGVSLINPRLLELMNKIPNRGYHEVAPKEHPHLYVGLCTFTTEVAKWLISERNNFNRPTLRHGQIESIASDIKIGDFMLTGETIIFDDNGETRNGQHRLRGGILADHPFTTLAVFGIKPEAFSVMDCGKSRGLKDVLEIEDACSGNYSVVSSSIPALCEFARTGKITRFASKNVRHKQMLRVLEQHPGIDTSARSFDTRKMFWGKNPTVAVVFHYVLGLINPEVRNEFFTAVETATHGSEPRWNGFRAMYKKIEVHFGSNKKKGDNSHSEFSRSVWLAYLIKIWNHLASNSTDELSKLQFSDREKYPQIYGLRYDSNVIPCDPRLVVEL